MDIIERRAYLSNLFDMYGELLTDKQRQMFDLYHQNDFSLGEIAMEYEISRQAVFDLIKRTEHVLEDYEEKLHLLQKRQTRMMIISQLSDEVNKTSDEAIELQQVRTLVLQLEQE